MTIVILCFLLAWFSIGAIFRAIGLAIRLVVIFALASAICSLASHGITNP